MPCASATSEGARRPTPTGLSGTDSRDRRRDRREGRLARLDQAGIVVPRQRAVGELAVAERPHPRLALDTQLYRLDAFDVGGGRHDLGHGEAEAIGRQLVEHVVEVDGEYRAD